MSISISGLMSSGISGTESFCDCGDKALRRSQAFLTRPEFSHALTFSSGNGTADSTFCIWILPLSFMLRVNLTGWPSADGSTSKNTAKSGSVIFFSLNVNKSLFFVRTFPNGGLLYLLKKSISPSSESTDITSTERVGISSVFSFTS